MSGQDATFEELLAESYDPPLALPEDQALPPPAPVMRAAARHRPESADDSPPSGVLRRSWPARGSLAFTAVAGALGLGLTAVVLRLFRR